VGDFGSLDEAISQTVQLPDIQLILLGEKFGYFISIPAFILHNLTIRGRKNTITFAKVLTITENAQFTILNATVLAKSDPNLHTAMDLMGSGVLEDVRIENFGLSLVWLTGKMGLFRVEILNSSAIVVILSSNQAKLDLSSVTISALKATFLSLKLGQSPNLALSAKNCTFEGNLLSAELPLFDLTGQIGTLQFANSNFTGNIGVLFRFNGSKLTLLLQNSQFTHNIGTLMHGYLSTSQLVLSAVVFANNSEVLINLLQFTGYFTLENSQISLQKRKGLFRFLSAGTPDQCFTQILNTSFADFHISVQGDSPGILHLFYCTGVLSHVTISNVTIVTDLHYQVNSLIGGILSIMWISNINILNSGTAGYLIGMNIGTLYISDFRFDNPHTGEGIYIAVSDGLVWVRNGLFTGGYFYHLGLLRLFDYNPIYIGTLVCSLRIDNVTITGADIDMGMAFGVFTSTFQVRNLSISQLSIGSAFIASSSSGTVTGLELDRIEMDMNAVQVASASNVTVWGMGMTNCRVSRLDRAVFQLSMRSVLTIEGIYMKNVTSGAFLRSKQSIFSLNRTTISDSRLGLLLNHPVFSSISLFSLQISHSETRLFAITTCNVTISNSLFEDIFSPGLTMMAFNAHVSIANCVFRALRTSSEMGKFRERSRIWVFNSSFDFISAAGAQGWSLSESSLTLDFCHFSNFDISLFQGLNTNVSIAHSSFSYGRNPIQSLRSSSAFGGVLGCVDCQVVEFVSVRVVNITSAVGGAVAVQRLRENGELKLGLSGSVFVDCRARQGGSVFISNVSFIIEQSRFSANSAVVSGGAVDASIRPWHVGEVRNCTFNVNAAREGGGIKWHNSPITLTAVHFRNNSALYGPDVASYGLSLSPLSSNLTGNEVSGLPLSLAFELLDHYKQRVTVAPFKVLVLTTTDTVSFRGNQMGVLNQGVFNFSLFTIYAPPASTQRIAATLNESQGDMQLSMAVSVLVTFRDCVAGEISRVDRCEPCYPGNVSFSPQDSECSFCPAHAFCPGGSSLDLDSGYWRKDLNSTSLLACLLPEKCLGGVQSTCLAGFTGALCSKCTADSTRVRTLECVPCRDPGFLAFQIICQIGVFGVFVGAVLRFAVGRPNAAKLYLVKTLLHYSQYLSVLSFLRVSYAAPVTGFLQGIGYFSSLLLSDFPLSCLGIRSPEYGKAVLGSVLFPILVLLFIAITRLSTVQWKANSLLLASSALLYTPFVSLQTALPLLICRALAPSSSQYLLFDLDLPCWEGLHGKYVKILVIPSLICNVFLPFAGVIAWKVTHPQAFLRYFPLWTCGNSWSLWEMFSFVMKEFLLTVTIVTMTKAPLEQLGYSLTILIVNAVLNVAMSQLAFKSDRFFFFSQGNLLLVALSTGLLGYFIFYRPGELATEYPIVTLFLLLNAVFVLMAVFLLVTQRGAQWFAEKAVQQVYVVTSDPRYELQNSQVGPPNNSCASLQAASS